MNPDKLNELHIRKEDRRRSRGALWTILTAVVVITGGAIYLARPSPQDERRVGKRSGNPSAAPAPPATNAWIVTTTNAAVGQPDDAVLTVSGYIVNRERIELSPRFLGVVKWIGVKKGDTVTNGQVVVRLDDAEYQARLKEAEGRLAGARAAVEKAELDYGRTIKLSNDKVESKEAEDAARIRLDSARAAVKEIEGQHDLAKAYLDWTVIRSPIDGVV